MTEPCSPRRRRLRSRVLSAKGVELEDALKLAQTAVDEMVKADGDPVGEHLADMRATLDADSTEPDWRALRFTAHDLKGFAGALGQPAVGEICESLCRLIERGDRTSPRFALLARAHLDAADHCRTTAVDETELGILLAELDAGVTYLAQDRADDASPSE